MRELAPEHSFNDPRHWRARGEEVRVLAEAMTYPETKAAMLQLADDYEHLAKRAEARAKGSKGPARVSARDRPRRVTSHLA